jgi:MFS family permease
LATAGYGPTFFVMAGLYALSILALARVPSHPAAAPVRPGAAAAGRGGSARSRSAGLDDIVDGLRYVRRTRPLLLVLSLSFFVSLLGAPYQQLLPGFVREVFGAGPDTLGFLQTVSAAGALGGALMLATLRPRWRGRLLLVGGIIFGAGILLLSITPTLALAFPVMILIGLGQAFRQSITSVLLQTYSEDAYRGRVMSVMMTQFAVMSLGTFVMGLVAAVAGPQAAFAGMALALIAVIVLATALSPGLRRLD